jgi:hypothetical protein
MGMMIGTMIYLNNRQGMTMLAYIGAGTQVLVASPDITTE